MSRFLPMLACRQSENRLGHDMAIGTASRSRRTLLHTEVTLGHFACSIEPFDLPAIVGDAVFHGLPGRQVERGFYPVGLAACGREGELDGRAHVRNQRGLVCGDKRQMPCPGQLLRPS